MKWKINRRTFLGHTGKAALGTLFVPQHMILKKQKSPIVRFGIVTDSHYADREPWQTRYYRQSLAKMKAFVNHMNEEKVDFVVHLGDFKDQDSDPKEEKTLQYLIDLEDAFSQFKGPRYHLLGNHDMDSISKDQFLSRVENTGIPTQHSYYSFTLNGVQFISLDPNFKKDGTPFDHGNFDWREAYIPREQLNWLEAELQQTNFPAIIFVHQVLDPKATHEHLVKNGTEVREILERSGNVLAVFQGHIHEEIYHEIENLHYYCFPGMVDGKGLENNSFAIAEVYANGDIMLNGYKRVEGKNLPALRAT